MNETEQLLEGWKEIAQLLNCSTSTMRRRKNELLDAQVIFTKWKIIGKPPPRRIWCAYVSSLKEYFQKKGYL